MKKKVLALIMAGTMALSMAACGNTQSRDTPKEPEKQETVQTEGTEAGEQQTYLELQQILLNLPRTLMYVFHLQQVVLQIRSQELSDGDYGGDLW